MRNDYLKMPFAIFTLLLIEVFLVAGCSGKKSTVIHESSASDTTGAIKMKQSENTDSVKSGDTGLSSASELMLRACDNYLALNDSGQKMAEVLNIKATVLYKNRLFERSRSIYKQILEQYDKTTFSYNAMQMIAQSYYEEKLFTEAQEWYRKLSNEAQSVPDREDALRRIAESIFKMAESFENQKMFKDAAVEYERVAMEFPESQIADIALFNAGLSYEKLADWSHAILVFQRLLQKYSKSQLLAKTQFRIAKNYEKMHQWDHAAEAYLKVVMDYADPEMGPLAMYNAGFCFESANKLKEAAATFEKLAILFPHAPDAPDVLFKAGEIYGKIKDWESVTRVNQLFTKKFGNDQDRIIQALCMSGIALYMQTLEDQAIKQLENAVAVFGKMKEPSPVNAFYAAKVLYTMGEIYHGQMGRIELGGRGNIYKKQLEQKSALLEKAIELYGKVIRFSISEWTTRAVFQIGQIYEDFGISIFNQQRPAYNSIEERMSLELGIAQAVEKYFVEKSLHYHELNVKLGIKEDIEDKYIIQSRRKLTYLPYITGENYLALVGIYKSAMSTVNLEGFSSVARTLQTLQKAAPFQEKAIELYLKCLELGSAYREMNESYKMAASNITGQSFLVGETYDKVVTIAREAKIPESFSEYERFVYKTKLVKQIEQYEEQALTHYIKTLKIAEAYKIDDKSVKETQNNIARLLFNKGWCYDLLATYIGSNPAYPEGINQAEKEEFRIRFSDIETKFRSQAVEIYKTIMEYVNQNYASGEHAVHAYMRLYQMEPEKYGVADIQSVRRKIVPDSLWSCSIDSAGTWAKSDMNDSTRKKTSACGREKIDSSFSGFPEPLTGSLSFRSTDPVRKVYFRRNFTVESPCSAVLYLAVKGGNPSLLFNGRELSLDTAASKSEKVIRCKLSGNIPEGDNVLVIEVVNKEALDAIIYPVVYLWENRRLMLPKPPGADKAWNYDSGKTDVYKFPFLNNFSMNKNGEGQ